MGSAPEVRDCAGAIDALPADDTLIVDGRPLLRSPSPLLARFAP